MGYTRSGRSPSRPAEPAPTAAPVVDDVLRSAMRLEPAPAAPTVRTRAVAQPAPAAQPAAPTPTPNRWTAAHTQAASRQVGEMQRKREAREATFKDPYFGPEPPPANQAIETTDTSIPVAPAPSEQPPSIGVRAYPSTMKGRMPQKRKRYPPTIPRQFLDDHEELQAFYGSGNSGDPRASLASQGTGRFIVSEFPPRLPESAEEERKHDLMAEVAVAAGYEPPEWYKRRQQRGVGSPDEHLLPSKPPVVSDAE